MAKDSNNNYVKIEDIKQQNSGENLENYRIYGNTVGGGSVGDRTRNLFDENSEPVPGLINDGGAIATVPNYPINTYDYINVFPNAYYSYKAFITANHNGNQSKTIRISYYTSSKVFISRYFEIDNGLTKKTITTPENCFYIRLSIDDNLRNVMLWRGASDVSVYEPCGYRVPVMVTNGMDAQTTNIYLPEQIKMVGDEAEYVDYQEQKMHRVRKNLLKNTATSQTIDGLTFTVNPIGSVTCNGRRENTSTFFTIGSVTTLGETILSGCLSGGSSTSFAMRAYSATISNPRVYYDIGDSCMLNTPDTYNIDIRIQSDYACNNLTFYPMIRKADIEDDTYEPYIENVDLDVTLPALPALSGTNTLSVETNTKPSKVWGKLSGPRDVLYVKDNLGNILFSKYHEIEGEPPLIYKPKKADTLIDYRIYGQTENGESVGDRTGNLFNGDLQKGYWINATDLAQTSSEAFRSFKIFLPAGTYTLSFEINVNIVRLIADGTLTQNVGNNLAEYTVTTQTDGDIGFSFRLTGTTQVPWDNSDIMLNEGSTALPYEPYGYKVPVKVEGKNLFNNIWEQGNIRADNGQKEASNIMICSDYFPVEYDKTYSISRTISEGYNNVRGYDASKNYIGGGTTVCSVNNPFANSDTKKGIFKITNSLVAFVKFNHYSNNLNMKYMIVEGDYTNTPIPPYEPYREPVITNLYLPEQIKMVGDEAEYVDCGAQKLHRVRKNLLQNTASSQTKNGVTFTVNNDGSVTCDGTASNNTFFKIGDFSLASQSYILTGCPSDGGKDSYTLRCYENGNIKGEDVGNGFNINESIDGYIEIRIASGYTCNNLIFYPMMRKADITDDTYEPYITNTELDVTLPALPTLSGINTLSVGTAVQPSKINIKGKIKGKIYGWHVDPDISNSSGAVTYLEDAREMFPASMRSTTFNYGSWKNAFFMPKPCMLKSNGKVDYYLDPNDYTKKLDGTTSDIANPNYDGNAMM